MAVIKAQASGNWSSTATWSGGVVPSLQDTVYANSYNITIDQNIDLTGSTIDTSGSFIPGQLYQVVSIGTTNFGLVANGIVPGTNAGTAVAIANAVGQIFQAVTAGTATTGTARRIGGILNHINTPLGIVTGGGFTISSNYNVTGAYILAGSANCLNISGTANSTLTNSYAIGSPFTQSVRGILFSSSGTMTCSNMYVLGGRVAGTNVANGSHGIESTSNGTIAFSNASSINGGTGAYCVGVYALTGAPQITFTGNCVSTGGTATASWSFSLNSASTITYTGGSVLGGTGGGLLSSGNMTLSGCTITGQSGPSIQNSGSTSVLTISGSTITGGTADYGIYNSSIGSLVITNSTVIGGSGVTSYGVFNASTGSVSIQGDIIASNSTNGFYGTNTGASVTLCGSQTSSSNGYTAVVCPKYLVNPTPTTAKIRHAKSGSGTYSDFYTADNTLGQASVSDVRSGVVYANNSLTGTCSVPSAGSVALGVPIDNTTGTAILTPSGVWNTLTNTLTSSNSIGERLKNVSTISSTGSQLAALTT